MKWTSEDGVAAVEFAILLPILMVIVFGIIEFSLALYNREVITNASREGARAGIVQAVPRPAITDIQSVVNTYLTNAISTAGAATVSVPSGSCGAFGNDLTVQVDFPYSFQVLPGLITGFVGDITLSAITTMKCE
jgi:Flp pilus assembly protein TadG